MSKIFGQDASSCSRSVLVRQRHSHQLLLPTLGEDDSGSMSTVDEDEEEAYEDDDPTEEDDG